MSRIHCNRFKITALLAIFSALVAIVLPLAAQNLWVDRNPYRRPPALPPGTILKLSVHEPVIIEYEYEHDNDHKIDIKMVPEKAITPDLPGVTIDKSIQRKSIAHVRMRSRLEFALGVTVLSEENGVITFQGLKYVAPEEGDARQEIVVTGRIHRDDVGKDRSIRSTHVGDLQIQVRGRSIAQSQGLEMKSVEEEDGTLRPSAELTEEERARLLLDYLNRVLGESKDL